MLLSAARKISPVLLSLAAKTVTSSALAFSRPATTRHARRTDVQPARLSSSMSSAGSPQEGAGGTAAVAKEKFTVAACQILCGEDKGSNIANAERAVKEAAAGGAEVSAATARHNCV